MKRRRVARSQKGANSEVTARAGTYGMASLANTVKRVSEASIALIHRTGKFEIPKFEVPKYEIPTAVREAFAYLDGLGCATDPGSSILASWMSDLEIPEALAVLPLLKPLPKKRGRKPGRSKERAEIEAKAWTNLVATHGIRPSFRSHAHSCATCVARQC